MILLGENPGEEAVNFGDLDVFQLDFNCDYENPRNLGNCGLENRAFEVINLGDLDVCKSDLNCDFDDLGDLGNYGVENCASVKQFQVSDKDLISFDVINTSSEDGLLLGQEGVVKDRMMNSPLDAKFQKDPVAVTKGCEKECPFTGFFNGLRKEGSTIPDSTRFEMCGEMSPTVGGLPVVAPSSL
ncbi:hypothetical protein LWI28_002845 [Acer negundo]|uniref:Uncharacterized protein n=1 Tax=Acer negundo TaxID=4023 RepID=A0AAD5NG25_ACENE|nr:hypothetical protein LWI28_002845 [Acer negundo]KAK4835625.1 hypothetical protein QYF36_012205 [Acer negundo]